MLLLICMLPSQMSLLKQSKSKALVPAHWLPVVWFGPHLWQQLSAWSQEVLFLTWLPCAALWVCLFKKIEHWVGFCFGFGFLFVFVCLGLVFASGHGCSLNKDENHTLHSYRMCPIPTGFDYPPNIKALEGASSLSSLMLFNRVVGT